MAHESDLVLPISLEEAAPAAAKRGFGLGSPTRRPAAADACTCAAISTSARSG